MNIRMIETSLAPGAIGPYSQGHIVNGLIYTSGQIPEELMQEMAGMSDVELAQLLQEHPELANMI